MILGQDLLRLASGLIEEDEVLQQIQEVAFVTDAFEQGLHVHSARLLFSQAFPLVEVLPFAGDWCRSLPVRRCRTSQWRCDEDVRDGVGSREVLLEAA